jgi:alpha-L-fucosidase
VWFLGWPDDGKLDIKSLAKGNPPVNKPLLENSIASVTLLGSKDKVTWTHDPEGLHVTLPSKKPCDDVFALVLTLR